MYKYEDNKNMTPKKRKREPGSPMELSHEEERPRKKIKKERDFKGMVVCRTKTPVTKRVKEQKSENNISGIRCTLFGGKNYEDVRSNKNYTAIERSVDNTPQKLQRKDGVNYTIARLKLKFGNEITKSDSLDVRFYYKESEDCKDSKNQNKGKKKKVEKNKSSLQSSLESPPFVKKGEKVLEAQINNSIIQQYKGKRSCYPGQKTVMGNVSAHGYVKKNDPEILNDIEIWEWLHVIAYCLGGPSNTGPQHKDNLVAGSKECNSLMRVFEMSTKNLISKNRLKNLKIKNTATFLKDKSGNDTSIAKKINYKIYNEESINRNDARKSYDTEEDKLLFEVDFFPTDDKHYPSILRAFCRGMMKKTEDLNYSDEAECSSKVEKIFDEAKTEMALEEENERRSRVSLDFS